LDLKGNKQTLHSLPNTEQSGGRVDLGLQGASAPQGPATAGARDRRFVPGIRGGIVGFGALILAALWDGVYLQLEKERGLALNNAARDASNFAIAFEEHIVRTLKAIDQATAHFRIEFERERGPFDFAAWLRAHAALRDVALQVAVVDEDKDALWSSLGPIEGRVDLSDREHIRIHVERDTGDLHIGLPVIGRVSGQWSIQLTRRLNKEDGSFGGVVVVSLDPGYLSGLYRSIDIGSDGVVTVVGRDGVVRARASREDCAVGQNLIGSSLFQQLARAPQGSYRNKSIVDGIDRLYSYRTVRDYPLHVLVGIAVHDALADFVETRSAYLTAAALVSLVLVAVLFALLRQAGALQALTADLRLKERELVASKEAVEQASRAKSAFLASMSHELRTPLNAIMGFAEVIQSQLSSPSAGQSHADYVRHIHDSGQHLLNIINSILDMSKIEAGRLELSDNVVDIRAVVMSSVRLVSARAEIAGVRIEVDIPPDCPPLRADTLRLRQMLLNLLSNAVKFTPGPGLIAVSAARREDGRLALVVADSGIGMSGEELALALQPFRQVDNRLSRRYEGTGLGLPLVKSLIELHGGELELRSTKGRGTVATLLFPRERQLGPAG
jgi:signal transduction histidine kinase